MSEPVALDRLDSRGVAGAVACCAVWGGNAVAVKYAISESHLPPAGCAGLRFAISLPIVALVCYKVGRSVKVPRSLWWLILVHGLFAAVQIGTFNWGTSHSEAGRSSVFINVHPLVVAPLGWLLLGEHLGARGTAGLFSAAIGVVVLLSRPLLLGGGLVGDLVVLGSGLFFGIQTIAQKLTFPKIAPTTLLLWQSVIALPLTLAYSLIFEGADSYHFTREALWGLAYQGLAVSGFCFSLWMVLLRRYPAGQLATLAFLTPLFGVGLGTWLRAEPFTWTLGVGGALVGLGIYLVAGRK